MNVSFAAADLLAHTDFLYRLAGQLGRDDAGDLAHDTWLAAQRRPPAAGNTRGWLATVMENLWRNRRRGERRRALREAAGRDEGARPDVADIVALEELRSRIVAAVVTLPEPLRQIVLLRYYEGLDSRTIGRRLELAPSTVRTRLQQALTQLRQRLDREHGGRRAAWSTPMLAWRRSAAGPFPAAAPMVVAGTVALLAVAWWVLPAVYDAVPGSDPVRREVVERAAVAASPPVADAVREPVPGAPSHLAVVSEGYPWERPRATMHGRALIGSTGEPASGFDVIARAVLQDCSPYANVDEVPRVEQRTRTEADGTFRFDELPVARYELDAFGPDAQHAFARVDHGMASLRFELWAFAKPERGRVSVTVTDEAGHGVGAAQVTLAVGARRCGYLGWDRRPPLRGETDAQGRFVVQREEFDQVASAGAWASNARGRVGFVHLNRESGQEPAALHVVLREPGAIAGTLSGLRDVAGVRVLAHPTATLVYGAECFAVAGVVQPDASFRIEGLVPGEYKLQIDGMARRADNEQFWNTVAIPVASGAVANAAAIPCVASSVLTGIVRDGSARAIGGAQVTARRPWENDLGETLLHHAERDSARWFATLRTATADDGTYELPLHAGTWQVVVTSPGRTMDVRLGVVAKDGEPLRLEHLLVADGAIAGSEAIAVRSRAAPDVVHVLLDGFHLRGLAPGTWEVGECHGRAGTFKMRSTVEVTAGTTQWIELTRGEGRIYRGVLRHAGMPLAAHDVAIGDRGLPARTGADGSFELRDAQRHASPPGLHVSFRGLRIAVSEQLEGVIELNGRMLEVRTVSPQGVPEPAVIAIGDAWDGHREKYRTANGPGRVRCEDGLLRFLLTGDEDEPPAVAATVDDSSRVRVLTADKHEHTAVVATFDDGSRVRVFVAGQRSVQIVRPATGTVEVRLVDRAGQPLAGWSVTALAWGHDGEAPGDPAVFTQHCADAEEFERATSDSKGDARLRGVRAGTTLIEALPPTWKARDGGQCQRIVQLPAGRTVRVELVAGQ